MRQGQPKRVLAQELDLYEPSLNKWVGSLQVLISNEGRQASEDREKVFENETLTREQQPASAPSVQTKHKKVYSKPLQSADADQVLRETATDYFPMNNSLSEEARKRLRVSRLKQ